MHIFTCITCKNDTLNQRRLNAGLPSTTSYQHWTNTESTYRVRRDVTALCLLPSLLCKQAADRFRTQCCHIAYFKKEIPWYYQLPGVNINIKIAYVTPVFKNPSLDRNELSNFRLVSGLNFVSKFMLKKLSRFKLYGTALIAPSHGGQYIITATS